MKRIFFYVFAALVAAIFVSCSRTTGYVTITGYAQGGTYAVKANLKGVDVEPEALKDSIDVLLQAIDNSVSGYNKGSILSRFNRGESVVPDGIFIDLYNRSAMVYKQTGGGVDVAGGGLFDIWGFGFKSGEMPSGEKVSEVLESSGMDRLVDDMRTVLTADGVLEPRALLEREVLDNEVNPVLPVLNFNAVAQGYSCDVVAGYLRSLGVKDMMVDIGEIFCQGLNPAGKSWTLGIDRPTDGNNNPGADLQGIFKAPSEPCGIVTSGNYRKFYVRDGKKYAHTIDPRSGYPVQHQLLSATIVAKDGFTADAYATYCMVVGPEAAKDFITTHPDFEACLVIAEGDSTTTWCSEGFALDDSFTNR